MTTKPVIETRGTGVTFRPVYGQKCKIMWPDSAETSQVVSEKHKILT